MTRPLDEPVVVSRLDPQFSSNEFRYYREWVRPQHYIDAMGLTVLRERDRIGALSLSRHESFGVVTDRDLNVVRLLAPHIRRAVAIGDVLNMQAIKIGTFEGALDLLQAGVLFVDRDCRIVHADGAARAMLEEGSPIQSVRGELRTHLPQATAALKRAVAVAVEPAIGRSGIGVPLPRPDGDPAHVHVLPLISGQTRTRLAPGACAALFVAVKGKPDRPARKTIAAVFELTATKNCRTLERLLASRRRPRWPSTSAWHCRRCGPTWGVSSRRPARRVRAISSCSQPSSRLRSSGQRRRRECNTRVPARDQLETGAM